MSTLLVPERRLIREGIRMGKKRSLAGRETLEQQKEQLSRCM